MPGRLARDVCASYRHTGSAAAAFPWSHHAGTAKRMASAVLGRALAFGVGLGVGSLGAYKFILDELRNSTKTILAANGALEKRLAAVERAA